MISAIERTLDVVIPVFNEEHVLADSVDRVLKYVSRLPISVRVVICNNGSTDATGRIARHLTFVHANVACVDLDMKGRGRALDVAWSGSKATYAMYMDVDLSTELTAMPQAIERLEEGADLVLGSRLHPKSCVKRSVKREFISRVYNFAVHRLFRVPKYTDMQCGFKAIRTAKYRALSEMIENRNWFFDTELVLLALSLNMNVSSIPVSWSEDTDSRVRIVSTVCEDIQGLLRLRRTLASPVTL